MATKKGITTAFSIVQPMLTFSVVVSTLMASAAMVALSFAIPLTVLQAYDRIIAFKSLSTLTWLSAGCLAALALNGLLEYGRGKLNAWTAARFIHKTDRALIKKLLNADPDAVGKEGSQRNLERFRNLGTIANIVIVRTLPTAAEAPFFFAYLFVLIFVGGWAATPSIVAGMLELFLAVCFRKTMLGISTDYDEAERKRVDYLEYSLERLHFIKAQAFEHIVLRGFQQAQSDEIAVNNRKMNLNIRLDEFSRMLTSFTTFGTILWGGVLVARGGLTVGAVSASLFFASRLVGIARNVRRTVFALTEAKADLGELNLGLELPSRTDADEPPLPLSIEGRLEFDEVKYIDPISGKTLIDGLSFTVRPGICASIRNDAFIGAPRESGRAICRLAAGIIAPQSGQVLIDAYTSAQWDFRASRGAVGYISIRSSVLPGTILDNIACFDSSRREGALDVAQLFGLDKIVSRLPRGFETEISDKDSGGLSASAIRLVTIARAMTIRPRLLIWDSADLDLDQDARNSVLEVLKRLRGATTMLIHSNDAAFLDLAQMTVGVLPRPE